MTGPALIHVVGVTAVWIIFLSAIRFALVGVHNLWPVVRCLWHLMRCEGPDKRSCRKRLTASLDRQYTDLLIAVTTPWSVMLLFVGMVLIGVGIAFGSVGDIAQLVAREPSAWVGFDRVTDLLCAIGMATGMAAIHAAVTKRRSISLLISVGFAIMGLGIGYLTTALPQ